jgi:flagellar protein FlgJ
VAPDTLIAQAALETGWGRKLPADASGRSSSNLFGVKAGIPGAARAVQASTTEYDQGTARARRRPFAATAARRKASATMSRCCRPVRAMPARWAPARTCRRSPTALQRGGYATDPDYVNKLVATVATLRQLRAAGLKS